MTCTAGSLVQRLGSGSFPAKAPDLSGIFRIFLLPISPNLHPEHFPQKELSLLWASPS